VNRTAQFFGEASTWSATRLMLDDWHGLWGGRVIVVHGDGNTTLSLYPVPQWECRFELQLDSHQVRQLLELCIQHDLLSITFAPRISIHSDEVRPTITLTNAGSHQYSETCWAGDLRNAHFEALYVALRRLERHTHQMQPVHEGPAQWS
jgi:hypothetical protein